MYLYFGSTMVVGPNILVRLRIFVLVQLFDYNGLSMVTSPALFV